MRVVARGRRDRCAHRVAQGGHHRARQVPAARLRPAEPQTPCRTASSRPRSAPPARRRATCFEWPALATTQDEASSARAAEDGGGGGGGRLFEALGENHRFAPGSRFTVERDPFDDSAGVEYVVRGVSHAARTRAGSRGESGASYANRITAFPVATVWREKFVTPRPAMTGIHSAVVLGGDGEEIHADQYGRVKVRFFWDHRAGCHRRHRCWVRVVQPWAGNTWGWQHLPRVGTEVAVAFLDGDPDRPVVDRRVLQRQR